MNSMESRISDKKTPEQIESEIERTRSAISEDIRALGDKLSPEQLKHEAREVLRDAKEEATDMLRTARDHAIESVTDTVHELSDRAVRVGKEAAGFASTHAVPLTLLGLGAGWLLLSLRHQRLMSEGPHAAYHSNARLRDGQSGAVGSALSDLSHHASELTHRAAELTHRASDRVAEFGHDAKDRVAEFGHEAKERVVEFGHEAGEQARRASIAARDFSRDNPLAVGALALAAGVGAGLLLPSTPVENQLLGGSRDRLLRDARDTADKMRHVAAEAVSEIKHAVTQA